MACDLRHVMLGIEGTVKGTEGTPEGHQRADTQSGRPTSHSVGGCTLAGPGHGDPVVPPTCMRLAQDTSQRCLHRLQQQGAIRASERDMSEHALCLSVFPTLPTCPLPLPLPSSRHASQCTQCTATLT